MRTITATMQDAIANQHGYKLLAKAEVFPSWVFFDELTRDYAIPNADSLPAGDNPMRQDIIFHNGLVTFYADGYLKYALDGNATPATTIYTSTKKPGVFGNVLFVTGATNSKRYSINWTQISNLEDNPLTLEATLTPSFTPVVTHAISETECVILGDNDGGFSISYFDGPTEILSTARFMFPVAIDWEGSIRDMESLGIFSTAFKLNNRIFVYMSNACTGVVQGIFYDMAAEVWSDIFTAMPTDLQVSLCEFRISNSFVRNGKGYLVGQFIRTDIFESVLPYTLILSTENGKLFSIDRFTLVSNLGYRFLGTVGSDNNIYLANSNRVCQTQSTWVFDGLDDSTSPGTTVLEDDLLGVDESNAEMAILNIAAGDETIFDNPHFATGSRVKLYMGYKTSDGDEYILQGTYIIRDDTSVFANGQRSYKASLINETQWKLSGLSMPFYAEIFGLSSLYDPMVEEAGKLYTASSGVRVATKFGIDFWKHEAYVNTGAGITGKDMNFQGGVSYATFTGSHKKGLITTGEIKDILSLAANPKITATTINVKIYGWSMAGARAAANDIINLVLVTCDEDGKNEETLITTDTKRWPITHPWSSPGEAPILLAVTGLTVGTYIKKVGIVFEQTVSTKANIARVEFVDNVEVPISLALANTPWTSEADGTFKVPAGGQPFIMFAQKPYNAWNFFLTAKFENTVEGGISGYPVAVGLVGLAEDAANYILARYDKAANKIQLTKCRNGIETILYQVSPPWALDDTQSIQFSHRDGHFTVLIYRESTSQYELVMEYDWGLADGFMCTSNVITKKCGIYGAIMAPYVDILAYAGGSQEDITSADGLAVDPLGDITDFPDAGDLRIGESLYSYTGKIAHPAYIDGPYQLRTLGTYPPPYGNGMAGLECLAFDWNASSAKYTGKLIAISNGSTFISAGSLWHVFIKTGGVKQYIYGRSRHYSSNTMIGRFSGTLADRVWPGVGGFSGVSLRSGSGGRLSMGEHAVLELTGTIKCFWFMGTGGEQDTTVQNLIETVCSLCGGKATFPGDFQDEFTTNASYHAILQDFYTEGYDLEFDLAGPATFEIQSNVKVKPDNYEEKEAILNDTFSKLVFTNLGSGNYTLSFVSFSGVTATTMYKFSYSSGTVAQHFRILYHENNISVYHNYKWVASIAFDELIYTQTNYMLLTAYSAASLTFSNVFVRDLSNWREAVYIDLETDGTAALGSIIQERPIEMGANPDGSLRFYYEYDRPQITLGIEPVSHDFTRDMPGGGASDAIIYGSHDVKTLHSNLFASAFGFSTKLFRLPNMNVGAVEATYRMLKKAFEAKERHNLEIRPDIRIMVGDVVTFSYTVGSDRTTNQSIIIENVSMSMSHSGKKIRTSMRITGRGYIL